MRNSSASQISKQNEENWRELIYINKVFRKMYTQQVRRKSLTSTCFHLEKFKILNELTHKLIILNHSNKPRLGYHTYLFRNTLYLSSHTKRVQYSEKSESACLNRINGLIKYLMITSYCYSDLVKQVHQTGSRWLILLQSLYQARHRYLANRSIVI